MWPKKQWAYSSLSKSMLSLQSRNQAHTSLRTTWPFGLVCRMSHLVQIDSMSSSSLVCCLVSSWDGGLSWLDLLHWKDVMNGSLSTKSRATFSFEPHELHRKQYYISRVEPQMRYIEMEADFNLRTPLSHWKITMMMRTVKYSHYSRTPIHS